MRQRSHMQMGGGGTIAKSCSSKVALQKLLFDHVQIQQLGLVPGRLTHTKASSTLSALHGRQASACSPVWL